MQKVVWLDDIRDPAEYGYPDAKWFKTSQEFMAFLDDKSKLYRNVVDWHFDNDLGELSETEGYQCLCALEEKLHFGKMTQTSSIYVHSSNPSAVNKFMAAKENLKSRFGIDMIRVQY